MRRPLETYVIILYKLKKWVLGKKREKVENQVRKLTWLMPGNVPGSIRNINAYIQ